MGGRGGGTGQVQGAAPGLFSDDVSLPVATRVAVAIEEIRRSQNLDPEDFVSIVDIHDKLVDVPSATLAQTMARMGSTDRTAVLNPQSNQKILTSRQHATAVRLGNENKHLIKLMPRGRDTLLARPNRAS